MFNRVLIANRGAIATRIVRTLQRLDIESVGVFAESDRDSLHSRYTDQAHSLGSGDARSTYLDGKKIIEIAKSTGAEAIHPGYGFLSENSEFAELCEAEGIRFVGPTPAQIEQFGLKHHARELAVAAGLPVVSGSDLLQDVDEALAFADTIGYPVMLKSTAGGGGIGLTRCYSADELRTSFDQVVRQGRNSFANDGVFIEKYIPDARHIEVQVFGDGRGEALAIGDRDCSCQRRHQKVIEECPAPNLTDQLRNELYNHSEKLLSSVNYRSAGTVEYIVDSDNEDYFFLEVNTRLQVEHGVTEMVYDIDLVEWMLMEAADRDHPVQNNIHLNKRRSQLQPQGHAIQARVYAEDPARNFQPGAGLLSEVCLPSGAGIRVDHWIEAGIVVPDSFDPMLAKIIAHADTREDALSRLHTALANTQIYGSANNVDYLRVLCEDPTLINARVSTTFLNDYHYVPDQIFVKQPGTQTTVQDFPGRTGYWHVGVPPSGPFDNYSFRLANQLLENDPDMAGLEITMQGPTLAFSSSTQIVVTGAPVELMLDESPVAQWQIITVTAGQSLSIGAIRNEGARAYLAVRGGIRCPDYLGSKSTFTLGQFGGHNGRALLTGDVLQINGNLAMLPFAETASALVPELSNRWELKVIYGPHGAPEFFTPDDVAMIFDTDWEVHYNSSRTGIRLVGPKPQWARKDGGDAGLHPSNIHDNAYAFGSVDFTGDMPVILGPDGPSLGGFVCPATVISADLWKLGQLRSGDRVRLIPVSLAQAVALENRQTSLINSLSLDRSPESEASPVESIAVESISVNSMDSPIVMNLPAEKFGLDVVYRVAGDHFLLIEYGEPALDLSLRFRVHVLMQWLEENTLNGLRELTPGIRSLQVHYDSQVLSLQVLLQHLRTAEQVIATQISSLSLPSRIVHLPLSWDDPVCSEAIAKYMQSVRPGAPWCPSNLEFIRRINGMDSIDVVREIVFKASYLVLGLGDVYLGAPVATPIDPSHRLVTTKYNPARTWTAENSVGIGGSYLCIYGMEGPGGYQFVGRTLQMWNRYRETDNFDKPWLLRFFDQIRFFPVSSEEMEQIRLDFPVGRYKLKIEHTSFNLEEYQGLLKQKESAIHDFRETRQQAYSEELARWHQNGQFHYEEDEADYAETISAWPEESLIVDSAVAGSVWEVKVQPGSVVEAGDTLMVIESMKMEIAVVAPVRSTVHQLLSESGQRVNAGQPLVVILEK
ncbi:MAG: urea carboxylase [Granulosicoccus sp.]|nr:urea carboxylase [Granulosicoccus sp.]